MTTSAREQHQLTIGSPQVEGPPIPGNHDFLSAWHCSRVLPPRLVSGFMACGTTAGGGATGGEVATGGWPAVVGVVAVLFGTQLLSCAGPAATTGGAPSCESAPVVPAPSTSASFRLAVPGAAVPESGLGAGTPAGEPVAVLQSPFIVTCGVFGAGVFGFASSSPVASSSAEAEAPDRLFPG